MLEIVKVEVPWVIVVATATFHSERPIVFVAAVAVGAADALAAGDGLAPDGAALAVDGDPMAAS
jgi:hypothetical protein